MFYKKEITGWTLFISPLAPLLPRHPHPPPPLRRPPPPPPKRPHFPRLHLRDPPRPPPLQGFQPQGQEQGSTGEGLA